MNQGHGDPEPEIPGLILTRGEFRVWYQLQFEQPDGTEHLHCQCQNRHTIGICYIKDTGHYSQLSKPVFSLGVS